jgi:hypothetical protein
MVCNLLKQTPSALDALGNTCKNISGVLNGLVPLPSLAQSVQASNNGRLPALPLPISGELYGTAAK